MSDKQQPIIVSSDEYRRQQITAAKAEAATLYMDTTTPGGRYVVGDQVVDANGQPVKDEPKADAKKADR